MAEKISTIEVHVSTGDDNKEDAQFECVVYQGAEEILHSQEGAGENWDNGDYRELSYDLDVNVIDNETVRVVCALQDGPWGRNNDWNANIEVTVRTYQGRALVFNRYCAFRTRAC